MTRRLSYLLYFLFWLAFAMLSSFRDWDLGYTILEIDLRAFMESFSLPTWSYQYCGGLTRSGDVNSLAESPWFFLPLAFGSYLGIKLLAPVAMTTSIYFLNKFLEKNLGWSFRQAFLFSIIFSLNGFWLLHFVHGHVGYSSQFLFICACLYFYDYFRHGEKRELFIGTLLYFLSFTLGFYQVATYMGLPAFLSVALSLFYLGVSGRKKEINWSRLLKISIAVLISSVLYSHKIYTAIKYQAMFPRVIGGDSESYGLGHLFYSLFIPTKDSINAFDAFNFHERYLIHEFSYFSLLNTVGAFALVWMLFRLERRNWKLISFSAVLGFTGIMFSLLFYFGDFSKASPFGLLNYLIFNNSHRVSPRYLLWGEFFICLASYQWVISNFQGIKQRVIWFSIILMSFIQIGFLFLENGVFERAQLEFRMNTGQEVYSSQMKFVSFTTFEYPRVTYFLMAKNLAVLNCYTPLNHPSALDLKFLNSKPDIFQPYFFFAERDGTEILPSSACFQNSYFTQTEIHIDDLCPAQLRLRLTDLNPEKQMVNYEAQVTPQGILLFKKKTP